ncbi:MAG: ABC transporter ATP-binding protein, partial [Comamonadaceae bacterium]|nr:ABC transporter ATP-binding protein [Comamonadaceae bacterium]
MLKSKTFKLVAFLALGLTLLLLPLVLQATGSNSWVRIIDVALLYVLLALGLNIVVGYAGLLDLGFIAFFAVGAYLYGLLASPHLSENFAYIAAMFPDGLHMNFWLVMIFAGFVAGVVGLILGAPVLKLRG